MTDIPHLSPQDFDPLIGQGFVVVGEHGELTVTLDNVKHWPGATLRDTHVEIDDVVLPPRLPFSLTLEGPAEPVLPSQTYEFRIPELGDMILMMSPFRQDQTCTLYEITFN